MQTRKCGNCQLCCRLVPVPTINKPANERCRHQSFSRGCKIYIRRPSVCALYSCRWLKNDDTTDLRRPDRAHYLIDPYPEFVQITPHNGSPTYNRPVIQIWCDPQFPKAYQDPKLLAYLNRRGSEGFAAVIRYSHCEGFTLFPPSLTGEQAWHEIQSKSSEQHSAEEVANTLAAAGIQIFPS